MKQMLAPRTSVSKCAAPLTVIGLLVLLTTGCENTEIVRRQMDRVSLTVEFAQTKAPPADSVRPSVGLAN
jgi:hypothetical protein